MSDDSWTVVVGDGRRSHHDTRQAAEKKRDEMQDLFDGDVRIKPPASNDGQAEATAVETADLPDQPAIEDDPVDWLPSHFVDDIEGVPTVNRKGYCVIASRYGVSVEADPRTVAGPDDEFAAFSAVAETPDGQRYTGFGTASVDRGDDPTLLNELSETRAMKRAVAWATGIGMTAVEELQGEP